MFICKRLDRPFHNHWLATSRITHSVEENYRPNLPQISSVPFFRQVLQHVQILSSDKFKRFLIIGGKPSSSHVASTIFSSRILTIYKNCKCFGIFSVRSRNLQYFMRFPIRDYQTKHSNLKYSCEECLETVWRLVVKGNCTCPLIGSLTHTSSLYP